VKRTRSTQRASALAALTTMLLTVVAPGVASAQPGNTASPGTAPPGDTQPIPADPPNGPGLGNQPTGTAGRRRRLHRRRRPSLRSRGWLVSDGRGGNGAPITPPGLPTVPVNVQPKQLSPDEKRQLADNEAEFERFTTAANEHDTRMRAIAKREFDSRSGELTKKYSDRIAKIQSEKAKRHGDTVAKLEKFLVDHPKHDQFTADAMFRLADLYIDVADDEVEAKLAEAEASGTPPPEGGVVADYSRSTALWERILTEFPGYRQTPSTLYLLGYYGKSKDERKSLAVFLALACGNQHKWNDTRLRSRRAKRRSSGSRSASCATRTRRARRIPAPRPSSSVTRGCAASPTTTSRSRARSTMRSRRTSRSPTVATSPSSTPSRSTSSRGRTTSATTFPTPSVGSTRA